MPEIHSKRLINEESVQQMSMHRTTRHSAFKTLGARQQSGSNHKGSHILDSHRGHANSEQKTFKTRNTSLPSVVP